MRKRRNKMAAFLTALILTTLCLCQAVFAAETAGIDSARPVSLSIDLKAQERIATICLYRVGEWDGSKGEYVLTKEFASSGAKIGSMTTSEMLENSKKLAAFAETAKLEAAASQQTESGKLSFGNLANGLYLICQKRGEKDNVTIDPFLTTLPVLDAEKHTWNYDVSCYPKNEADKPDKPNVPGGGDTPGGGRTPSGGKDNPPTSTIVPGEVPQGTIDTPIVIEPEGVPLFSLPKTGDESVPTGVLVSMMAGAGLFALILLRKQRKNEESQ
ncbi:MAG: pilin N-terminal domain-containing protein [Lachnospiraceae bacterium]|nr:pilin N-terminal domain-containing protein [Lachnospiraceae bacterium]